MKRPTDFTMLSNVVTSVGMHASWGREGSPEQAVRPCATIARARRGGYLLYLHMGHNPDRATEATIIRDLEAAMDAHRIAYEAQGHEYMGGTRFAVYAIEE